MIIVDTALARRHEEGNPVRVGVVGSGFTGRHVVDQIHNYVKGMCLVAVFNRTRLKAEQALHDAGVSVFNTVVNTKQLEESIAKGRCAVAEDYHSLCEAEGVDVIIEATSDVEFTANVAIKAIENKKNIVLINADCDATVGPILKVYADRAGVTISGIDGDQPGSLMNLYRFVKSIGFQPVVLGNIKGLLDFYRTPETQKEFAAKYGLSAKMATSFADGTKISTENTLIANATGFGVGKRGMFGPKCDHVDEVKDLFPLDRLLEGGIVDYVLGARPGPGVFVLVYDERPRRRAYMKHYKMGNGPLYVFYTPYHLASFEVPLTAARAVLFNDAAVASIGGPVCDVITVAKRDLKADEVLDGIGGFTCYGMIENTATCQKENLLLMGLSEGSRLKRDIAKDQAITNTDVEMPESRLIDKLRAEQDDYFYSSKNSLTASS